MTTTSRIEGLETSLAVKAPVRVATTANITLSGLQTIDSVLIREDERVLVKDQTLGAQNGIYIATAGDWSRAADWNGARDATKGTRVFVTDGATHANTIFFVTTNNPIVIGVTVIVFAAEDTSGFDVISPINALGEIIYGDADGSSAALSGNITTTRQFLSQTGDGSNSAAPAWNVLTSSDLPIAPITKGGTGETVKAAAFDALAPSTTKGDLIAHNGTDNVRLPVGTNGAVLVANSSTASGLAWDTVAGGGSVFDDSVFRIQDNGDSTKKLAFEVSGVSSGATRTLAAPNASDTIVGATVAQTLTNKTLTAPVISEISNSGTLTLPTSTDTLVGRNTADTLTNKTLTSPTITGGTVNTSVLQVDGVNVLTEANIALDDLSDVDTSGATVDGASYSFVYDSVAGGYALDTITGGSGSVSIVGGSNITVTGGGSNYTISGSSGTGDFDNPYTSRLEVSINGYNTNPTTIPYDTTNGGLGLSSGGVYTAGTGGVIYQTLSLAEANGTSHDVAGLGAKAIASVNDSDVWGATIVGVTANGTTGCSAHGLEIGIINQGASSNNTFGLVIVGDGNLSSATTNDAAIQIQNQRNTPAGTGQFLKGIVFNPSPQQMVTTTGTLIECSSGTYANGIDFGTSDFTGGNILKSAKYNFENAGAIDFKGQSDADWLTVKVNGVERKTPLYDTSATVKPTGAGSIGFSDLTEVTTVTEADSVGKPAFLPLVDFWRFDMPNTVDTIRIRQTSTNNNPQADTMQILRVVDHSQAAFAGVNAGFRAVTQVTNANAKNYEWAIIGKIDSAATAGENVGVYGQAWGTVAEHGPLWGMVAEARDRDVNSQSTLHGIEIDCFGGQGVSTNRNRIGAMIVAGNVNSGLSNAPDFASECWAGLYIQSVNAGTGYHGYYRNAIHIGADPVIYPTPMTVTNAINIYTNGTVALWDRGNKNTGIALDGVYSGNAIRIPQLSTIGFDSAGVVTVGFNGSFLAANRGFEVNANAGSAYLRGIGSGGWGVDMQAASLSGGLLRGQSFEIQAGGRFNFKDSIVWVDGVSKRWGGAYTSSNGYWLKVTDHTGATIYLQAYRD